MDTEDIIKKAKNEYYKQYRDANKDKINAYQRQWRAEHKDKARQYFKRYWLKKAKQIQN